MPRVSIMFAAPMTNAASWLPNPWLMDVQEA